MLFLTRSIGYQELRDKVGSQTPSQAPGNISNQRPSNLSEMSNPTEPQSRYIPAGTYLLKFNNRNTRASCETRSKLTIKTPEQRHWRRSGVFIVNPLVPDVH